MNIDKDTRQNLDLLSRWIGQYGCLLETFAHMRYVPKYHVLVYLSNRFDLYDMYIVYPVDVLFFDNQGEETK